MLQYNYIVSKKMKTELSVIDVELAIDRLLHSLHDKYNEEEGYEYYPYEETIGILISMVALATQGHTQTVVEQIEELKQLSYFTDYARLH
jgi:hypothetical protein